jgi:hypothetical protein
VRRSIQSFVEPYSLLTNAFAWRIRIFCGFSKEAYMKYISSVCFIVAFIGFIFASYIYAASLEDEAKKKIRDTYISKGVVECGDSLYICFCKGEPDEWFMFELKGVYYFVTSQKLTYADELNHIEWKGYGGLTGKAVRKFERKTGWGKWTDHEPGLSLQPDFYVEKKKNGQWTVSSIKYVPPYIENPIKYMTCEEIKRIVK